MTNAILRKKTDARNLDVQFDAGEVASAKPMRGIPLYTKCGFPGECELAEPKRAKSRKRVAISLVCALVALSVYSETWYLAKDNASSARTAPFTDPSYWKDAAGRIAMNAEIYSRTNDFVIGTGRRLRTNSLGSFTARSLQIGVIDQGGTPGAGTFWHEGGNLDFGTLPSGLIWASGEWDMNIYISSGYDTPETIASYDISGDVSVSSLASAPFKLKCWQYPFRRTVFTGSIHGDADAGFQICPHNVTSKPEDNQYQSFGFRNLADYWGSIELTRTILPLIDNAWVNAIEFGSTVFPGSLMLDGEGTAIKFVDRTNQVSVANLEMGDLSRIVVETEGNANGSITVTGSYRQTGVVILEFNYSAPFERKRMPVLTVPDATAISESDFVATNRCSDSTMRVLSRQFSREGFVARIEIEEDKVGRTKTVCLVVDKTLANQTVDDSDKWTDKTTKFDSSMTNASHWTDGTADHSDAICFVNGHRLRTPTSTKTVEFPGEQLVLNGASAAYLYFCAPTCSIDKLYVTAPCTEFRVNNGTKGGPALTGQYMFIADGVELNLYHYANCNLIFNTEIIGGGTIKTHGNTTTSSSAYYVELPKDNSNWHGSICLQSDRTTNSKYAYPNYNTGYPRLYISDGRNLGGKMSEYKYDALRLCHYARLIPRAPITLEDGLNRGVCIDGAAVFDFDSGHDITIKQPLTVGGSIYKTGMGTLALGGKLRFLNYSEPYGAVTNVWRLFNRDGSEETVRKYGDVTVADMPDAFPDLSYFSISEGYLKVMHADCVDGLTLDFSPTDGATTGLRLDFNPPDDDLRLYGVRNVKTITPFVSSVNVTFDNVGELDQEVQVMTNGIFTVRTDMVKTIRSQFNVKAPKVRGFESKEIAFTSGVNGEYTTIGYEYKRRGLILLFR